nr:MAG TPA: hypothetical protein [Caudoviricetes sp.]
MSKIFNNHLKRSPLFVFDCGRKFRKEKNKT